MEMAGRLKEAVQALDEYIKVANNLISQSSTCDIGEIEKK